MDLSETGLSLRLARLQSLPRHMDVVITSHEGRSVTVRARLVRSEMQQDQVIAAIRFVDRTPEQHRRVIELMYSAPDSWDVEHGLAMDSTEHLRRIMRSVVEIVSRGRLLRRLSPRLIRDLPAVLDDFGSRELDVRAVDVSYTGVAIAIGQHKPLPIGTAAALRVSWNDYEQTTFDVKVVNTRAEGGQAVLGLAFVNLDGRQRADLANHLDPSSRAFTAEGRAA
jgi:hypothetical protein